MKKTYIIPFAEVMLTEQEQPLATSGVVSNNGIGFGGVDEDGNLDAEVRGNIFGESSYDVE